MAYASFSDIAGSGGAGLLGANAGVAGYATIDNTTLPAVGDAASGGPTRTSLTASVGPAAVAGLTYRINDRWHLHGSYGWSRVDTTLTADTDGVIRTSRIRFGPQALIISVGYSFGR